MIWLSNQKSGIGKLLFSFTNKITIKYLIDIDKESNKLRIYNNKGTVSYAHNIFSCKSDSRITNVDLSVCQSVSLSVIKTPQPLRIKSIITLQYWLNDSGQQKYNCHDHLQDRHFLIKDFWPDVFDHFVRST